MKTNHYYPRALLAGAALLLTATLADTREFGFSTSSVGRGTKIETERGGTAYVGPRGFAAESAGGQKAAAGRRGRVAVTDSGDVYARRNPAAVVTRPVAAPLPAGYIRVVPAGYTTVVYRGYTCRYVGGVYYRPVMYQGSTVYVVVK